MIKKGALEFSQLKVILSSPYHHHNRQILLGEDSLCFIEDMQSFYQALGYTGDMAKEGVLPEEFIWKEYIHKSGYSVCLQNHIVDYLHAHSPRFNEVYGEQYEKFVQEHAEAQIARGSLCAGCKLKERGFKYEVQRLT